MDRFAVRALAAPLIQQPARLLGIVRAAGFVVGPAVDVELDLPDAAAPVQRAVATPRFPLALGRSGNCARFDDRAHGFVPPSCYDPVCETARCLCALAGPGVVAFLPREARKAGWIFAAALDLGSAFFLLS